MRHFIVLSLFSRAAFSSAARAAASPSTVVFRELGLRAQNADYPLEHGESFEPHTTPDEDPSSSLVSPQAVLLPPTTSPATSSRERFRRELLGAVQTALSSSAAPGTVRMYEAVMQSLAPRVVANLGRARPPSLRPSAQHFCSAPCLLPFLRVGRLRSGFTSSCRKPRLPFGTLTVGPGQYLMGSGLRVWRRFGPVSSDRTHKALRRRRRCSWRTCVWLATGGAGSGASAVCG